MKAKALQYMTAFLCSVGALTIFVLLGAAYVLESDAPRRLVAHPNAHWVGAQDGGVFIEVTKASAPDYYVQVRHETGELWSEGWIRYGTKESFPLSTAAITGFDGDELFLQSSVAITSKKAL